MPKELSAEDRAQLRDRLAARNGTPRSDPVPVEEPDEEPPVRDAATARRQRLLAGLDAETAALFTDAELEKIEREEQQKAAEEKKKQALADVRATARQRARVDQDLISASVLRSEEDQRRLSEMVTFRLTVPGDGAGGRNGAWGIRVDGRLFQSGQIYTEPRIVYESLLSNNYRLLLSETQFKTLDQHKPGGSAIEVLSRNFPQFEMGHA